MKDIILVISFVVLFVNQISSQKIELLKTPDVCFENLPDYTFAENFLEFEDGLLIHYVDEGDKKNPVILLVHGEPNWSYSYRNIIPVLVEEGYRVIVPDLIGFGKSDKPIDKEVHTYTNHTKWLKSFINKLKLTNINCYAHDWGAMLSLRIVAANPELFKNVAISYGFLFTGEEKVPDSFYGWQKFSQTDSAFHAGTIVNWGTYKEMPLDVQNAYNAPFPNEKYKAGIRQFPVMVPTKSNDPEAIINKKLREKLKTFDKPFLTIWGDTKDEMWLDKNDILQKEVPGAKGQDHKVLKSNHFIQDDKGNELGEILLEFFSVN